MPFPVFEGGLLQSPANGECRIPSPSPALRRGQKPFTVQIPGFAGAQFLKGGYRGQGGFKRLLPLLGTDGDAFGAHDRDIGNTYEAE
jgi:hypothetical protein